MIENSRRAALGRSKEPTSLERTSAVPGKALGKASATKLDRLSRPKAGAVGEGVVQSSTAAVRTYGKPRAVGHGAARGGTQAVLSDLQRPHTSPRLDHRRPHPRNAEPIALSAIGRRTTSVKVPAAPAAPAAVVSLQHASGPGEDVSGADALDTFAKLGAQLQIACSGSGVGRGEERRALGACLSAIGSALQRCGGAISQAAAASTPAALPPAAAPAVVQLDFTTRQELRDLRLVNEGLQRKAQNWLAERDKLHKLVDELRRQAINSRHDSAKKPPILTQVGEEGDLDTDRSAASDTLATSHRPAAAKPKCVPSLNFKDLQS
mmetsp:Transcript_4246/g.12238  ORF Transcript_4246/g.12238 Transcript_4246/m.12238 type:complete len:322 (-) Transcript_4246:886-1851(-)